MTGRTHKPIRERTFAAENKPLRPAIAADVLFNVGEVLAGVIYTIAYRVATGHMPPA